MKHLNIVKKLQKTLKSSFKLALVSMSLLLVTSANAQVPAYGTTQFNNDMFDQVPFASGTAYPSVMTATNVASTGWSFHIGAIGAYVITQVDNGIGSYDGAITASNVTPNGFPKLYQTFAFTSTNFSMFKLNSVRVKISNNSAVPVPMILAGVISGQNTGSTQNFVAMPGSNWVTVSTASDPNFSNINGVIVINATGSTAVAEMAFDDINISAPNVLAIPPVITSQPTDKTVCTTASTSFTGTATGAAGYFWLISTDGLIWNPITALNAGTTFTGYNTNTLTVTNPSLALNGLYLGLTAVSSLGVNKGSNAVRLYVTPAPVVPAIGGPSQVCAGSTITLTNATPSGVWTSTAGRATVNGSGVVTGGSAGTATIVYTVSSGGCTASASKNISVNSIPAVPTIAYAPGTPTSGPSSPFFGAPTGSFCVGKSFSVVGSPIGGVWSATGASSITNLGLVSINSVGAGTIKYTYTNPQGCSNSRTLSGSGFTCAARGINETLNSDNENFSFDLYPNPSRNFVNITLNSVINKSQVTITDIYGKNIKNQQLSIGNNRIDISNLNKGIYFINVATNQGTASRKLVVE
ncbi:MAG: T9SS type A sorting domain-containing protein [Dolichospermum sp.]